MRITRSGLRHYLELAGPDDRAFIVAVLGLLQSEGEATSA